MKHFIIIVALVLSGAMTATAQDTLSRDAVIYKQDLAKRKSRVSRLNAEFAGRRAERTARIQKYLRDNPNQQRAAGLQAMPDGTLRELYDIDNGIPIYRITHNDNSAETIGTDLVRTGGGLGFDLDGHNAPTIGIWDGGAVRATHVELTGRVTQQDGATTLDEHATHVAGTMIARGIDARAMGMAPHAELDAYDWGNDDNEMLNANLLLSNHSYGFARGWRWTGTAWQWVGDGGVSQVEDFQFGRYNENARAWDQIAFTNYNYLIVTSAGNDRNDNGVAGSIHPPDGPWDCIADYGVSKNVLTVGAVHDINGGYGGVGTVVASNFTSWGPVDDGRVKPDIVANGVSLRSTEEDNNTDYGNKSGTSMAAPSVTGSIALLHELDNDLVTTFEGWSSTFMGLVIHSADEAGNFDGPDYSFGWGMMNTARAAHILQYHDEGCGINALSLSDGLRNNIRELQIDNNETINYQVEKLAGVPLKVTLVWTDPAGAVGARALDNRAASLINDLDLRIIAPNGATTFPWRLNPNNPGAAATRGDNTVDNVEQVIVDNLSATGTYTIRIHMESTSLDNDQYASLIVTGHDRLRQDITIAPGTEPFVDRVISGSAWWQKAFFKVRDHLVIDDQYTIESDGEATFHAARTTLRPGFHAKAGAILHITTELDCDVPYETTSEEDPGGRTSGGVNVEEEVDEADNLIDSSNQPIGIYPNPAHGLLTLDFGSYQGEDIKAISIVSLQGRKLMEKGHGIQQQETIDFSGFAKGIYIVNIQLKDGTEISRRVIKE